MDVLEIARQRRTALARELAKLDEFIRMGEELQKVGARQQSGQSGNQQQSSASPKPVPSAQRPSPSEPGGEEAEKAAAKTIRQFSAGGGGSS